MHKITTFKGISLNKLLEEIAKERLKLSDSDIGFPQTKRKQQETSDGFWTTLFYSIFISLNAPRFMDDDSRDDLVFFVEKSKSCHIKPNLRVLRRISPNLPIIGDPLINWEETVYLNLIVQSFVYVITLGVYTRSGTQEIEILKKRSRKVYASPSYRPMDFKGMQEIIVYPHVVFPIDDFELVFSECVLRDSECLCIELTAYDRHGAIRGVLFESVLRYSSLKNGHDIQRTGLGSWHITSSNTRLPPSTTFLRVCVPRSEAIAEVAIQQADPPQHRTSPDNRTVLQNSGLRRTPFSLENMSAEKSGSAQMRRPNQKRCSSSSRSTGLLSPSTSPLRRTSDVRRPSGSITDEVTVQSKISQLISGGDGRCGVYSFVARRRRLTATSITKSGCLVGNRMSRSDNGKLNDLLERFGYTKKYVEIESSTFEDEFDDIPFMPVATSDGEMETTAERQETFGQAWHWFKERRRITSTPIKAAITYVSIPCHLIISGILESKKTPVLTSSFLMDT